MCECMCVCVCVRVNIYFIIIWIIMNLTYWVFLWSLLPIYFFCLEYKYNIIDMQVDGSTID